MSQAASKGLTVMRFGNGLNGPLSIMKGWSWSVYVQNENEQTENKTATATSGRAASGVSPDPTDSLPLCCRSR